jgi:hypothetical protein
MLLGPLALASLGFVQDPAPQAVPAPPPPPSIWDRLSLYADGRLRWESTFDQPAGAEDRHRGRMRFRVGGFYQMLEKLRMEARLSTASPGGDANNPHWDFGDGGEGFSGAEVVLDRFYVDYTGVEDFDLKTGKFPHAFALPPVYSELMWDLDVHPAGFAEIWDPKALGSGADFDVRAVQYIAVESGTEDDPSMFGLQGNLTFKPEDPLKLQLSASYSHWSSLNAGAGVFGNQGNTDVTGDFAILEGFVAATYEGGPLGRTTGFIEGMDNVADDLGEEAGLALGAQLGKAGKKDDRNVFAVYYDLEANAVFSPVAQDDTPIPGTGIGTGMDGWIFGGQWFMSDLLAFRLWALTSDANASDDPFRIRFDFDFKIK